MPSGAPGTVITLSVHYRDSNDVLVDPPNPRVDIIDPAGTQHVTDAVPTQVVTGIYSYAYLIPADGPLGEWVAHWTGTIEGNLVAADETFSVVAASSSSGLSQASTFTIHQGDLLPIISATLRGPDGQALNLSGTTVTFRARLLSSQSLLIDAAATVGDPDDGVVSYAWQPGDTDTAGVMLAEWLVTYPDDLPLTIPNESPIVVVTTSALTQIPAISDSDLAVIRAGIGASSPPTDVDIALLLDSLGSPEAVVHRVLAGRYAAMVSNPLKLDLDGDLTVDLTANAKALAQAVKDAAGVVAGGTGTLVIGSIARSDRPR